MKRWLMLGLVCLVLLPEFAAAQVCKKDEAGKDETAKDCFNRLVKEHRSADAARSTTSLSPLQGNASLDKRTQENAARLLEATTTAAFSEKLALKNTGGQSLSPGLNSSTKDFENDLIALLESSGAGNRMGDTLTVHLGFPIHAAADKKNLELSVALKDPKLDPAVTNLLTGKDLDNAKSSIDQRDRDVTLGVAWSIVPRSLTQVVTAAKAKVAAASPSADPMPEIVMQAVNSDSAAFWSRRADELDSAGSTVTTNRQEMDHFVVNAFLNARSEERRLRGEWVERRVENVTQLGADAADEQSQFWGGAQYHYTDTLIGSREVKVNFTYELSTSTEATRQFEDLLVSAWRKEDLTEALDAKSKGSASTPATKPRFSFTGEYHQVQRRTFTLPILAQLDKASSHVVSLAAVAGWKIATLSGDRNANLDFNGTFENDSSNAAKKNRLIASLTFSQKLSDKITLPLSLVYASHSTDLDVSRRFSAHFGINYKMPPGNANAKKAQLMAAMSSAQ
jgi:hypothetical protein